MRPVGFGQNGPPLGDPPPSPPPWVGGTLAAGQVGPLMVLDPAGNV